MDFDYSIKIKRKNGNFRNQFWIWKLAWNDARHNFRRLFLFISSVVIGIAALVAINSFNLSLQSDINSQAKELLGADLAIDSRNKQFSEDFLKAIDSLPISTTAMDARFASMVYFPKNNGTRLIQVLAIQGKYPFYGEIKLSEDSDIDAFYRGEAALIDEVLSIQYQAVIGDSLKLGGATFVISGIVRQFPGNTSVGASFAPSVYLPYDRLGETGLIQYGSRIDYNKYLFLGGNELDPIIQAIKPLTEEFGYRYESVESRKESLGRSFQNLYRFFNLLGFIALILGCIGVSSSVHIYLREKRESAAILRCIGGSGWQIFFVFFIQINILGLIGTVIGVFHGVLVQYLIPYIVKDFLPVAVTLQIHWMSVLEGLLLGFIISVLFAVLPLSNIRLISPLEIFRATVEPVKKVSKFRFLIIGLIILFPWFFAVIQTESLVNGSVFAGSLVVAFIMLWLTGKLIILSSRKFFPRNAGFIWRQSMANLFRPNNQTIVLVVVIGLGSFILATMSLIQNSLLGQVEFAGAGKRPNTILFDIQPYQKQEIVQFVDTFGLPVQQLVPIVTMRIQEVKERAVAEWQKDTTDNMRGWSLTREYRVTYRDSLIESEKIISGTFINQKILPGDSIFISISDGMQKAMELELKDKIIWDVQGVPITTYIGSVREVDWQRIQTNFMVVFPEGVLEQAPQFYVLVTRTDAREKSAEFQQKMVKKFPNVSVIDLTLILDTLDGIFNKVELVIRFMALFSVITGLFVLSGAVVNSKYARLKENVLLRTIGASQKQLVGMTILEYAYLGIMASLSGCILAILSSWALARFFFEIKFVPDILSMGLVSIIVIILVVLIGWLNTRSILNRSPLEVLRKEI